MQIKHYLIILIALPILIASSCGEKEEPQYFALHPKFMDYAHFNTGSFWIYKDSVSGAVDTHTVFNSTIGSRLDINQFHTEEYFAYSTQSSLTGDGMLYSGQKCFANENISNDRECGFVLIGSGYTTMACYYPPVVGAKSDWKWVTENNLSLQLNGSTIENVHIIYDETNDLYDAKQTYTYFAGGLGIVKKRIYVDDRFNPPYWRVWELTNHNIIQ